MKRKEEMANTKCIDIKNLAPRRGTRGADGDVTETERGKAERVTH